MLRTLRGDFRLDPPGKGIEVLGALLADYGNTASGFLAQRPTATAWTVGDATVSCQNVEVALFDMDLPTNLRPIPILGQRQARESPSLNLFPSILGQEGRIASELGFDLVQPDPPPLNTVTIDAKDEEIHHTPVLVDDFLNAFRFQGFDNSPKQGVMADADTRTSTTDGFK